MTTNTPIQAKSSLMRRAKQNDPDALHQMFAFFVAGDFAPLRMEYCGTRGLWGIGTKYFYAISSDHIAVLEYGLFGRVVFSSAMLQHLNSVIVHQPSKFGLYRLLFIFVFFWLLVTGWVGASLSSADAPGGITAILVGILLGMGALALPFVAQWYYGFVKCGCFFSIREGFTTYLFTNRSRMSQLAELTKIVHERQQNLRPA